MSDELESGLEEKNHMNATLRHAHPYRGEVACASVLVFVRCSFLTLLCESFFQRQKTCQRIGGIVKKMYKFAMSYEREEKMKLRGC